MAAGISAKLLEAYRSTRYFVRQPGSESCELLLGRRNPQLDGLIFEATRALQSWALLTAYNPRSRRTTPELNRNAHRRLKRALLRHTPQVWPGAGVGTDWSEPMWLAVGIDREDALQLARRFRQNALLYATGRGTLRLLLADDGTDAT